MKSKTIYFVDQKDNADLRTITGLIKFCRQEFPGVALCDIEYELGIVSIKLSTTKTLNNLSKQVRYNKNPR